MSRKKFERLQVYLPDEVLEMFKRKAKQLGLRLSEYCRYFIMKKMKEKRENER